MSKHLIEGDFNHVSVNEVKALIKGDGSEEFKDKYIKRSSTMRRF